VEVVVVRVLVLELFLECLVLGAEQALHQQQVREYFGVVARHLVEHAHVAVVHVVIADVHHRRTEDGLIVILGHDQGRVGTLGRDGGE